MSIDLHMDQNAEGATVSGLRRRGVDVLTANEDGRARLLDERLLERSTDLGRLLFTEDTDFLSISARWLEAGRAFAGIAYAWKHNISVGGIIDDLELIAKVYSLADARNVVLHLPL